MANYKLSNVAKEDLIRIHHYGVKLFGIKHGGNGAIGASIIYDNTVGASVDVLFGTHTANYSGKYNVGPIESSYTSKVKLTTVQIPILFRLDSEEGYLEIGPQLNVITSANYSK